MGGIEMKKLLSIGLVASLSLTGLVACGNDGNTNTPSSHLMLENRVDKQEAQNQQQMETKLKLNYG